MTKARRGGELLELVIAAQDFASSNPLNRVYGLLGILPAEKAYLQPDYSRKTSQLYIDLIAEGLKISNSLGYISTGGIGHRSHGVEDLEILISKLPSWVPDFKQPVRPVYLRHPAVPHIPEFQASAESQADYQFLSKNRILEAKGFICDKIRKISLPFVDDYITSIDDRHDFLEGSTEISEQMLRNAMQSLKNYIETIDPDNHAYPLESISWRQALFRSILLHEGHVNAYEDGKFHCNTCSEQYGEKSLGYMLLLADIGYAELATPAESGSTDIPLLQVQDLLWRYFVSTPNFSEPCPALAPDFVGGTLDTDRAAECKKSLALALSGPATANTSFFVIVNGFYGISDASVQQGDDICILLGCPVPLLVRRLELDWVVVGDCYVFGMTYGEMTEKVVSGELKLDTFRFR
jgi:hypothetical protein